MSEAKFTKGEWAIDMDGQGLSSVWCGNDKICCGINFDFHAENEKLELHNIEAKANAHLIAVAPEMYEALSAISKINLPQEYLNDDEVECLYNIDKLLAKARGE